MPRRSPAVWDNLALAHWPTQANVQLPRRQSLAFASRSPLSKALVLAAVAAAAVTLPLVPIAWYLAVWYLPHHADAMMIALVATLVVAVHGELLAWHLYLNWSTRGRLLAAMQQARMAVTQPQTPPLLESVVAGPSPDSVLSRRAIWSVVVRKPPAFHQSMIAFNSYPFIAAVLVAGTAFMFLPLSLRLDEPIAIVAIGGGAAVTAFSGIVFTEVRLRRWRHGARNVERGRCPRCAFDFGIAAPAGDPGPALCPQCNEVWPLLPAPPPQGYAFRPMTTAASHA